MDPDPRRLELTGLVTLNDRPFALSEREFALLSQDHGDGRAKNISLAPTGRVRGTAAAEATEEGLAALMRRYADWSETVIAEVAPTYLSALIRGRTSYRSRGANEPAASARKDDRRLHIDAFASQPTGGRRILRVFSNISPRGEARLWRVGEPFEEHARRWLEKLRRPWPGEGWILQKLGITRARRSDYDFLMLSLHDHAKLDLDYQAKASVTEVAFPAPSTWVVYTDSTVHAALAGRFALEQTFYLPVEAMAEPAHSPLRILERLTGRVLA